ncbi:MAG: HNH endonuclease [Betaproteobacteria bacterium RIFCSPLOWO2_12_FULL_62_13]|nr:MAG: HNH endonuclease [Betaproteobacteria bacterium RIFCSPLOWO2_12_FULL_62_13]
MKKSGPDKARLDRIIAEAKRNQAEREKGYREQALKMYPWICGRCGREFTRANVQLLEVHHRDHNHENNPPDGSNWELLCTYCHENEHRRYLDTAGRSEQDPGAGESRATYRAFAGLDELLKRNGKTRG